MFVDNVKQFLPKGNFDDMIAILKKFLGFMNLTVSIYVCDDSSCSINCISLFVGVCPCRVSRYLKKNVLDHDSE